MHTEEKQHQVDEQRKYNMILDTAANPSYINTKRQTPTKLTHMRTVQTLNGKFKRNRTAMITLTHGHRAKTAEAIVHKKLPTNLLSTMPIVKDIGPILLDNAGAAVIPENVYQQVKSSIRYFEPTGGRTSMKYQ